MPHWLFMAESIGLSTRQIQKYLKRLQELGKITRVGGRKMGEWKIIDEEYEGFFDRIWYVVLYSDMDKLTKEQRHRCMSAIKGKNTKPELLVRKFLFGRGFRYRLNHPRLPGHPDLVLRKYLQFAVMRGHCGTDFSFQQGLDNGNRQGCALRRVCPCAKLIEQHSLRQ